MSVQKCPQCLRGNILEYNREELPATKKVIIHRKCDMCNYHWPIIRQGISGQES